MDDDVSVPRELLGEALNVLGNAASIWPNAVGAKSIREVQFKLLALLQERQSSAGEKP